MKTLMLFLLIALSTTSYCQMVLEHTSGNAQFQKVFDVPGKTAAELYPLAVRWVAKIYKNPDAATNSKIENEMIRGEGFDAGNVKLAAMVIGDMKYSGQVDVKDSRVRFTISNMYVSYKSSQNSLEAYLYKKDGTERTNSQAQNVKEAFTNTANSLFLSLEANMTGKEKADDW